MLQVHEQLERPRDPVNTEDLGDTEKAIVREMCNVVWRKLGDVGGYPPQTTPNNPPYAPNSHPSNTMYQPNSNPNNPGYPPNSNPGFPPNSNQSNPDCPPNSNPNNLQYSQNTKSNSSAYSSNVPSNAPYSSKTPQVKHDVQGHGYLSHGADHLPYSTSYGNSGQGLRNAPQQGFRPTSSSGMYNYTSMKIESY